MSTRPSTFCASLLAASVISGIPVAAQERPVDPLTPGRAGQMSLRELMEQEVVFAASRYEQNPSQAATAITIITAEEIQQFGYRTMQDVLSAVHGFYTTYDRNYTYLGVRGISPPGDYNARVLVQVDGHRINENTYDGVYIGTDSLIDLALVERVEVVHGPGSSLYGSNAVFAVVNFVTRRGGETTETRIQGDLGSFGTQAGRIIFGAKHASGVETMLAASRYASDGQETLYFPEYADSTPTGGITRGTDGDEYQRLFGRLSHGRWSLQGAYADRTKTIPTASYGTVFDDPRSRTTDRRGFASLTYRAPVGPQAQVTARVALDRYAYDGDYVTDYGDGTTSDVLINRDLVRGTWLTAEVQGTRKIGTRHQVVGGVEYRDNTHAIGNYDRVVYSDIATRTRVLGLFAQDEWKLHPRVALMLGLRHDRYPSFGGTTNPRLAMIVNAASHTTLKLALGRAFRPPNLSERSGEFDAAPGVVVDRIRPETLTAREVVLEQRVDRFLGGEAWFSVSGYRNDLRDLIGVYVVDGWSYSANMGTASAYGVEVEARTQWPNRIVARGSVSLNRAADGDGGGLDNAPGQLASARIHLPIRGDRLGVGVQGTFIGSRLSADGTRVPRSTATDLTLVWTTAGRRLLFSANVRNLFDAAIFAPTSDGFRQSRLRQDGRTLYLTTGWRF